MVKAVGQKKIDQSHLRTEQNRTENKSEQEAAMQTKTKETMNHQSALRQTEEN